MRCRDCTAGKRISRNGRRCVFCRMYGMILREDHECTREGWKTYEYIGGEDGEETGLLEDGGGAAGEVPGIFP